MKIKPKLLNILVIIVHPDDEMCGIGDLIKKIDKRTNNHKILFL